MSNFYRLEFVRGPHDGLVVEGDTLVAPCLRLPAKLASENCSRSSDSAPLVDPRSSDSAPLYELSGQGIRWDAGAPQAVLRYEFRGEEESGSLTLKGRLARWLAARRQSFGRWLMTPIDYPMTTRSIR